MRHDANVSKHHKNKNKTNLRLRGPSPSMNQMVREFAFALRLDLVTHTPGVASEIIHELSRKFQPDQFQQAEAFWSGWSC